MQQSTGYFQRLSQRSGLTREPAARADSSQVSSPVVEVNETRELVQPLSEPEVSAQPVAQVQTAVHDTPSKSADTAAAEEQIEKPQQHPDQPSFHSSPPGAEKLEQAVIDTPSSMIAPENIMEFKAQTRTVDNIEQLEGPVLESLPTRASETPETLLVQSEPSAPAATSPSFIRELVEQRVPEFAPQGHEFELLNTPTSLRNSVAQTDTETSSQASLMHVQLRAAEAPESIHGNQKPETRVSIGQISIEVHTPAGAPTTQTVARPPAPAPVPRARQTERPTNLHRYYLRGG